MENKELTYNDFLQRLDMRDILLDAGYHQNRRFGLRLPSFSRMDSEGKRIRGDKFVITKQGKCCTQPPRQREYNVVSFIKEHPLLFAEYRKGMDLDRLVNLVCSRLLYDGTGKRRRSSTSISRTGVSTFARSMLFTAISVWQRNTMQKERYTPVSLSH